MIEQRTKEWKIQRLGHFTGSRIAELMVSGKEKDEVFGKTAMSYIYEVASERNLRDVVLSDDTVWQMYDDHVSIWSREIQFGIDWEPEARRFYMKRTGFVVEESESVEHPTIPFLSASPDGIVYVEGIRTRVLEIKCPTPSVYMKYVSEIHDNASLKKVNKTYYYQTQAEMMVTGASFCDFTVFNPFMKNQMHIVSIEPDKQVFDEIKKRVERANMIINEILSGKCFTKSH